MTTEIISKATEARLYITGKQFDELSNEDKLEFRLCTHCKRFYHFEQLGGGCRC